MALSHTMKQFKTTFSKMSPHNPDEPSVSVEEGGTIPTGEDTSPVWTTGQYFQFYVPWLWKESPAPPSEKLHPNRQVVRVPRLTNLPGFTEEFRDAWIRQCVTTAVKDLVYDKDHYLTCTETQLEQWRYDKAEAWKHFSIVQRNCNLPRITIPGYDGVLPVEMTIAIKEISVRQQGASSSSCIEWLTLPSPGKCVERIKNQILIYLTTDCSMHIHIRPKNVLDFDLQSFKKIASLLWLAEDRLDELYHPARRDSNSPWHRSLRRHTNLALDKNPLVTGHVDDLAAGLSFVKLEPLERNKLVVIWQTAGPHELRELLRIHPGIGRHDYPAYNFFNLFMASEKQTIEFRKTESTVDARVIDAWIEVFVLLANFCMTCSTETFQRVMENLGRSQNAYGTWHLLRDIGCKRPVIEVLKKKSMQQWLPEGPAPQPTSRAATTAGSNSGSKSATKTRLRDAMREGAERFGGKIARGYSYGH